MNYKDIIKKAIVGIIIFLNLILLVQFNIKASSFDMNKEIMTCEEECLSTDNIDDGNKKNKKVYLTFDDGPCNNTLKILDILNKENVKATFFVIGKKVEERPDIIKKLNDDGMFVASHSYSHDYKEIYKNPETYLLDLEKCNEIIEKHLSSKPSEYIRVPGGSAGNTSNKYVMNKIREELISNNYKYIDWNVTAGDAAGRNVPVYKIINTVKKQCKDKDYAVILMHDSYYKKTTVEALPSIIEYLREEGFSFETFYNLSEEDIEILKKERVINKKPLK